MFALQKFQRGMGRIGEIHVVMIFERVAQTFALRFLVIDDEDGGVHSVSDSSATASPWPSKRGERSCNGSQTRKVVPRFGMLSRSMRPPCSRTMRCTIIQPSPDPFF